MLLVVGGAYQGKHDYLRERFGESPTLPVLDNLHLWVRARLDAGDDPLTALSNCLERYRDGVVVCEDISCGIVPLDPADRRWREATGRCGALVAAQADEVVRLFCGIPTRIK